MSVAQQRREVGTANPLPAINYNANHSKPPSIIARPRRLSGQAPGGNDAGRASSSQPSDGCAERKSAAGYLVYSRRCWPRGLHRHWVVAPRSQLHITHSPDEWGCRCSFGVAWIVRSAMAWPRVYTALNDLSVHFIRPSVVFVRPATISRNDRLGC